MTIKAKKSKINLREKLAELLNFRQIRDRLDGLGLYLGKDRTGTTENLAVRGGASIDDLQLAEISAALGGTAVDVFVYDTRKDSDGGKWRERTSHTSWYNEELNTATRGSRREFPAVAVIVAETNKVTIYDGDDPDLGMWMVFSCNISFPNYGLYGTNVYTVSGLNGTLAVGSTNRIHLVNFVTDEIRWASDSTSAISIGISNREGSANVNQVTSDFYLGLLVNTIVNDVAMTILPNAPIDEDTGLPVPTIAVATDGGVSVIKDDGTVVDINGYGFSWDRVYIKDAYLTAVRNKTGEMYIFALSDLTSDGNENVLLTARHASLVSDFGIPYLGYGESTTGNTLNAIGKTVGVTSIDTNYTTPSSSLAAYTTSSYNTGWMPGDIKLATLSDTKNEKVGVDESTELIGDATYGGSDRLTSYTYNDGDATVTIDNNESSNDGYVLLLLNGLIVGKKYKIEMQGSATYTPGEGYTNKIANADGNVIELDPSKQGTTNLNSLEFTASSINFLYLYGGDLTYTLSLKQTGELITNGTFDNGTEGWDDRGTSSLSVVSGELVVTGGPYSGAQQEISTVVGKKYIISGNRLVSGGLLSYVQVGTASGTGGNSYNIINNVDTPGPFAFEFTGYTTSTFVTLQLGNYTGTATFDNISVRLAEDDRSVNDNELQVFGQIDKTPVAPGADLVAYSGFSANNYLMQPYNSDLDFGTGDFCIMGWFKTSSQSSDQYILDRSTDGSPRFLIAIRASGGSDPNRLQLAAYDASGVAASLIATDFTVTNNVWTNFCAVFDGSKYRLFVDGVQSSIITESSGVDISNDGSPLIIGARYDSSASMSGELALLRISATAPTDAQIAKIYQDEKQLFTDGAQATLYGTSDAVTALAYDDKTELLHVGTSDGRSDFSGLRRINNTTTAVTTSISASNNLIAEQ
jgi:hypothetical protein